MALSPSPPFPQPQAAGKQGASPAKRESRGNVWHTALLARCSVLHPVNAGRKNRGGFSDRRGGLTRRKRRGKPTPARRRLWGVLPKGDRGGGIPNLLSPPSPLSPAGQDWPVSLCRSVNDRRRGRFTPTVTRLPDERNQPALFLPRYS